MLGALMAHAFLLGSDGSYHEWDAARYEVRALGDYMTPKTVKMVVAGVGSLWFCVGSTPEVAP